MASVDSSESRRPSRRGSELRALTARDASVEQLSAADALVRVEFAWPSSARCLRQTSFRDARHAKNPMRQRLWSKQKRYISCGRIVVRLPPRGIRRQTQRRQTPLRASPETSACFTPTHSSPSKQRNSVSPGLRKTTMSFSWTRSLMSATLRMYARLRFWAHRYLPL